MFRLRPVLSRGGTLAAMEWPEPWFRLAACGWTTARLGTLDDLPKRGLREVLEQDPVGGGRPVWRPGLGGGWQDFPAGSGGGGRGSRRAPLQEGQSALGTLALPA